MNKSEYVSLRLSSLRSKQLDALCSKTGDKKGVVARKALELYLDKMNQSKPESLEGLDLAARITEMDLKLDVILRQQSKKWWFSRFG